MARHCCHETVITVRTVQTPSFRRTMALWPARWGTLTWILFVVGCAAPAPLPVKEASLPARLEVINETDYEWTITTTHASGEPAIDSRLRARATLALDLRSGDYRIEQKQVALPDSPPSELSRKISLRVEPGQAYRWRLATLLSEPAANSNFRSTPQ